MERSLQPPRDNTGDTWSIWRFAVEITDEVVLHMPRGARVLAVGPPRSVADLLDLWAEVNPKLTLEPRAFAVVGTGRPVPSSGHYVGTALSDGGLLIWHVYELGAGLGDPYDLAERRAD